ncbi:hypothetical protein BGZ88_010858 [Linnemannia elongata]|nr:hypothetical protein BGZ88_010858 [Linnemannia elongata]
MTDSHLAGIAGISRLDFFCSVEGNKGKELEIEIEGGKLVKVEDWAKPSPEQELENHFPLKACGGENTINTLYN